MKQHTPFVEDKMAATIEAEHHRRQNGSCGLGSGLPTKAKI
jgi:hypothetical protein